MCAAELKHYVPVQPRNPARVYKTPPKEHTCKVCGAMFLANNKPAFCSIECKREDSKRRSRAAWPSRRKPVKERQFTCEHCGEAFITRHKRRFCSKHCAYRAHAERNGARPKTEWENGKCAECGDDYKRKHPHNTHCDKCKSSGTKYRRRILKRLSNKHARSFDTAQVLDRDGWRCYICGTETPKHLRGTYEPNAPEVDHIVPIAKGGTHTANNMACSCLRCNRGKSDHIIQKCYIYNEINEMDGWANP